MKKQFSFHSPVLTYVNSDFDQTILDLVKNKNKIAIISGRTSINKTGFKNKIENLLKEKDIIFFSDIEENPSINTVLKGGKIIKKHKTEIIIAFGGGSVLDAAKAIALFAENQGSFYEILNSENLKPALPVLAIPTTCGTGSEMNNYAIITDKENMDKVNLSKNSMFPVAAILEPEFLNTLPKELLIATVFDAFTHSFEGFLSKRSNPFSDTIAIKSIEIILETIKKSNNFNKINHDILNKFLYASSLAGIVILHTGTTLLHALGYFLTNHKKIHHGKANALLFKYYIELCDFSENNKILLIDTLFKSKGFQLKNFSEDFYGKVNIDDIIPYSEADDFIKYAIGKKNAAFSPFEVEFQKVKQVLYP